MLYKLHSFFFLLATLLLSCKINFGQTAFADRNSDYIITKRILTVENGLPANSANCAIQDKDGFMWFGTDKGLSRYDGKNFTNYSKEKNGLSGDRIMRLLLDDSNRLVIVSAEVETFFAKVNLMDLRTYTISTAKSISNFTVLKSPVNWKTNENSNLKYLENNIALYLENKRIEIYSKEELSNLPTLSFSGNYLDQYGNNWLCSSAGVFEIRCRKNLFDNYFNNQPTKPFDKQVRNIYTEADFKNEKDKSDKRIYACMGNKFLIQKNNKVQTVTIKDYFIYSLLKTSEKFYVGGSSLRVLDLEKLAFQGEAKTFGGEIWRYTRSRGILYMLAQPLAFFYITTVLINLNN